MDRIVPLIRVRLLHSIRVVTRPQVLDSIVPTSNGAIP